MEQATDKPVGYDYLECLAGISSQLLAAPDPWPLLPGITEWLRQVTNASRCYVYSCRQDENGRWLATRRLEAVKPGIAPRADGTAIADADLAALGYQRWIDALAAGNEVQGKASDLAAGNDPGFLSEDAEWILVLPLVVENEWLGFIGFDQCDAGSSFSADELLLLRAAANAISAALERLAALRGLRKAHTLAASILRSASQYAIIATDLQFRILHYNPVAESMFGYTESAVLGRPLTELGILEPLEDDLPAEFVSVLLEGGAHRAELEIRDPAGEYRTLELLVTGMEDESGTANGYLLIARDVTEQLQQQRRSLQSQRMESVGLLAGGIAHDFNNILMGILGYASLAKDKLDAGHPAQRMLSTIEQSGERAAALTNELLAYARGGKYQSVAIRLDEQVTELFNILATNLPKSVTVDRQFADNLPYVIADPVQLQQVIMNVCLNAGDAIRERQQQLGDEEYPGRITVSTGTASFDRGALQRLGEADEVAPGKYVFVTIEDNGCGMDEETRERIFEPFFTTKFTGRGLGLSAVEGIIRNHGGFLRVESELGVGSRFTVFLPASALLADEVGEDAPVLSLAGAETILFVDDEETVRQLALLTLTNLGYQVLLAENGRDAINVLQEHRDEIALVILDLTMPGMSGRATMAELVRISPVLPVLLTSGYDESTALDVENGNLAAAFLQKPYTPEALSRAVRTVLDEWPTRAAQGG